MFCVLLCCVVLLLSTVAGGAYVSVFYFRGVLFFGFYLDQLEPTRLIFLGSQERQLFFLALCAMFKAVHIESSLLALGLKSPLSGFWLEPGRGLAFGWLRGHFWGGLERMRCGLVWSCMMRAIGKGTAK